MIRNFLILILLAAPLVAQEDANYQKGLAALDSRQWDQAIAAFDASAGHKSSNADGALYWKAYALNRAGRRDEALGAISALRRDYAASRWNRDKQ